MRNNIKFLSLILLLLFAISSCEKKPTEYKKYLGEDEITYPGKVLNFRAQSGDGRLLLTWNPSSDPNIKSYLIYWNDNKDSLLIDVKSMQNPDLAQIYFNDLLENELYTFKIYSLNEKGDRSVPTLIEDVRVYGDQYRNSLLNRSITGVSYLGNSTLVLYWGNVDTVNVNTVITYTDITDQIKAVNISGDEEEITIPDWKYLSEVGYQSSFKPNSVAIDTFKVLKRDSIRFSEDIVEVKKPWIALKLKHDADTYNANARLEWLWDGIPNAYPQVYHTARGSSLPHIFSFDLGRIYTKLTQFEEWGRQDPTNRPFSNPIDFEVWGIVDTTNAIQDLPPDDAGWEVETLSKGWTLLAEIVRTDDGINAWKVDLIDNPPPVRYIRIRVKETIDHNTDGMSHMSELSFWYSGLDYSSF